MARQQQQIWPRPLPSLAPDEDVLTDRKTEGQSTVRQSVSPSSAGRARAKRLTPSAARLVDWIELYAVGDIPKDARPAAVSARSGRGAFVGGRLFVLKYGPVLILEALNEMTYMLDLNLTGGLRRYWRDSIVSPAQYLHWMVKELAATEEREEQVERRLRVVEKRGRR